MKSVLCVDTPNLYTDGDILHTTGYSANISLSIREIGLRAGDIISATCQNITYNGTQNTRGLLYMYPQELSTNPSCPPCLKISLLQGKNGIRRQDVLTDDPYFGFIYFGTDNTDGNVTGLEIYKLNKNIGETLYLGSSDLDKPENPIEISNVVTCKGTIEGKNLTLPVASKNLFNCQAETYGHNVGAAVSNQTENSFRVTKILDASYTAVSWGFPFKTGTITLTGSFEASEGTRAGLLLYWHYDNAYKDFIGQLVTSGQSATMTFSPPNDRADLCLLAYASLGGDSPIGSYVDYYYVQVEFGETATPYTPYVTEGTPVNITACGGNIYNPLEVSSIDNCTKDEDGYGYTRNSMDNGTVFFIGSSKNPLSWEKGKPITFSWDLDADSSRTGLAFYGESGWIASALATSVNKKAVATTKVPEDANRVSIQIANGDTKVTKISNIMVNYGDEAVAFSPYTGATYPATAGQSVEIVQYDKITNVFTDNAGVTVSARTYPNLEIHSVRSLLKAGSNIIGNQPMSEQ